nr:NaeI family type II restriction endonuclease [Qaidamihabitans albus]
MTSFVDAVELACLQPIVDLLRSAVDDAIRYILDGARTFRFDLTSPEVDSDERSSVGTKLQYHVIVQLKLLKEPPLDTKIMGIPVEIKGTVGSSWMIPREGQCQVTLLIRIDARKHRFRALLMRTHRAWLGGGKGNQDLKRSPLAEGLANYALEVAPWNELPAEPLRSLTTEQLRVVFGSDGVRKRVTVLFGYLPETIIPRASIATVATTRDDPLRRARQAKPHVLSEHDLVVLVGTWLSERKAATQLGFYLGKKAWVVVRRTKLAAHGYTPDDFNHAS